PWRSGTSSPGLESATHPCPATGRATPPTRPTHRLAIGTNATCWQAANFDSLVDSLAFLASRSIAARIPFHSCACIGPGPLVPYPLGACRVTSLVVKAFFPGTFGPGPADCGRDRRILRHRELDHPGRVVHDRHHPDDGRLQRSPPAIHSRPSIYHP